MPNNKDFKIKNNLDVGGGKVYLSTAPATNTTENSALVLDGTEVKTRELSGGAFLASSNIVQTSGDQSIAGNKTFSGTTSLARQESSNSNIIRLNQRYTGASAGAYYAQNEYQKIVTITPNGDSENYQVVGRMFAQSGAATQEIRFNTTLRSNTLPDLSHEQYYEESHTGTAFFKPQLWVKETAPAGFVIAAKYLPSSSLFGSLTVDIDIIPRNSNDKPNIVLNDTVDSEITSVDTGFTANDMNLISTTIDDVITFAKGPKITSANASSAGTSALVLDSTEIKTRTLGSNAFNSTNFLTADVDDTTTGKITLSGANPQPLEIHRTTAANAGIKFTNAASGVIQQTAYLGLGTSNGEINIGSQADVRGNGNRITTVADTLNAFAATTSAQLAGTISDETGSGSLVFATSPTLVTPALGTPASGDLQNCTFPNTLATKKVISTTLTKGTYSRVARIEGADLGSAIRVAFSGDTTVSQGDSAPIMSVVADIMASSEGGIYVSSTSASSISNDIKVISNDTNSDGDGEEDFEIYIKYGGGYAANTMDVKTTIFPLGDETITGNPSATAYTGSTHVHSPNSSDANGVGMRHTSTESGGMFIRTDGPVRADTFRGEGTVHYVEGNTSGTAGTWTGTNNNITSYYNGLIVAFKHGIAGASTTTLNINSLGAKTVYRKNSDKLTTHIPTGTTINYVYDSSDDAFFAMVDIDNVSDYELRWSSHITAGSAIQGRQLLMEGSDGKFHPVTSGGNNVNNNTVSTQTMRMGGLLLLYESSTDRSADDVFANDLYSGRETNNLEYWTNHPESEGAWGTQGGPLYLVGTEDANGHFVLDNTSATSFLAQALPSSDDGKIYIHLGYFGDTIDNLRFTVNNPAYQYINGQVQPYTAVPRKVTVTLNDSASENDCITFLANAEAATGDRSLEIDSDFTYNPGSGTVTAANFSGTASLATTVTITDNNEQNATHYLTFVDGASGAQDLETEGKLFFNPSTGILNTTRLHLKEDVGNGPRLTLELSAANPSDNDVIAGLDFKAKNSEGSGAVSYASIEGGIVDETAGTTDGQLLFRVTKNNSSTNTPLILTGDTANFGNNTVKAKELDLLDTTAGSTTTPGPLLKLHRDTAANQNHVLGRISFEGDNDAQEEVTYGFIQGRITNVSTGDGDGTETGTLEIGTIQNGSPVTSLNLTGDTAKIRQTLQFDTSFASSRTDSPTISFQLVDVGSATSTIALTNDCFLSAYGFYLLDDNDTPQLGTSFATVSGTGEVSTATDKVVGNDTSNYVIDLRTSGGSSRIPFGMTFGKTNTDPIVQPFTNGRGYLGNSNKIWDRAYIEKIFVTSYIDLGDGDYVSFGASDDAKFFYDGGNNDFELELESDCDSFVITDNGTHKFTFTKAGAFTATGNITAFSDARLKTDVKTLDPNKTLQMRGVEFIKDGEKGSGVIAQELEKVAPELVLDGKDGYKSVAYGNLTGYLIETVKEQQKQIDELKELVQKLLEK